MDLIENNNESLKGVLPKNYGREDLDKQLLGQVVDVVSNIKVGGTDAQATDVLGQVYEYFLEQFAIAEGRRGGEFYTPRSLVRLLVEMIEPYKGRVFDPCCCSAGMFIQSVKFIQAHATGNGNGGKAKGLLSIYGQESNQTTLRLAKMNLAIRGIEAQIEYRLLWELSKNAGQLFTHARLLRRVWGPGCPDDPRLLRTFIRRLRSKLGDNARSPTYIFTEPQVGYWMASP